MAGKLRKALVPSGGPGPPYVQAKDTPEQEGPPRISSLKCFGITGSLTLATLGDRDDNTALPNPGTCLVTCDGQYSRQR